jgi:CRISPR-associated protein Csx10
MGGIMNTHRLTYRITTLSPLVLSKTGREGFLVNTRDFIPGTVLLGMCAARYIQRQEKLSYRNAHEDKNFQNWFLNGALCFNNAYITSKDELGNEKENIPIPLSIQQLKDEENYVYDLLFEEEEHKSTSFEGYGRVQEEGGESPIIYTQPIKKSLNFHHQHDPVKGTAKQGIFFNYESIEPNQTFTGEITGSQNLLQAFKDEFKNETIFYVGRSRNTQYGKIKLEWGVQVQPLDIANRPLEITGGKVSLTLLSDLLIYNENGLSTNDTRCLETLLKHKIKNNDLKIEKAFIKNREVENYVAVWKLRSPSENCFKAGSCFLVSGLKEDDAEKLAELVKNGIGERQKKGFGKIAVNIQQTPGLILRKLEKGKKKAPIKAPGKVPDLTKNILATLVKNLLKEHLKLKAIMESKGFENLPAKSAIGRLEAILKAKKETSQKTGLELTEEYRKTLVNDLRKTAVDALEKCHNRQQTLLEFITAKTIKVEDILTLTDSLIKEVNRLISEKISGMDTEAVICSDRGFEQELYFIYFQTFFNTMRKRKKIYPGEER